VVLETKAALFDDSRYTLQARAQTDGESFELWHYPETDWASFLAANAPKGARIGYDPTLHTLAGFKTLQTAAEKSGFELVACEQNPLDAIWTGRPPEFHVPMFALDEIFAGESVASKLARVRKALNEAGASGLFVCAPDNVAWLFNLRGRDVRHTPIALVRAFVPAAGRPALFVSPGHLTAQNESYVGELTAVHELDALAATLKSLLAPEAKILIDPAQATLYIADAIRAAGAVLLEGRDPIVLFKARKNPTELQGARNANFRDGAAVCRFLAWLDATWPSSGVDEMGAAAKLEAFRRETHMLEDLSFDTISAAGPNGAIVHYRVTPETNRPLLAESLYLVDSGGQYRDGTTDITRTVAIGTPSDEMRRHYTLVLKGHIAIATARFPANTRGVDLDAFARRALWAAGLDYGHGTGHGVGSFLSVHEGPQTISRNGMVALEPGMILSNEPGYYREGDYGIRLENLVAVTEPEDVEGGEKPVMGFETLTLAPVDRRLIRADLLSRGERAWLNAYHARVRSELSFALSGLELEWLAGACAPI
jgi:Xaa-Pro aminopeptidase